MSGGGLFKGRYLVGVTNSGYYNTDSRGNIDYRNPQDAGGFSNLRSIYKLLDESGYSYVYRFILIFDIKINLF